MIVLVGFLSSLALLQVQSCKSCQRHCYFHVASHSSALFATGLGCSYYSPSICASFFVFFSLLRAFLSSCPYTHTAFREVQDMFWATSGKEKEKLDIIPFVRHPALSVVVWLWTTPLILWRSAGVLLKWLMRDETWCDDEMANDGGFLFAAIIGGLCELCCRCCCAIQLLALLSKISGDRIYIYLSMSPFDSSPLMLMQRP